MKKDKLLLLLFFIFSITCHKIAQLPFEKFVEVYDHLLLRNILLFFGALVFIALIVLLSKKLRAPEATFDKQLFWLWVTALALTLFSYFFLMPYKAESMHLIQYGIMGALSTRVVKNAFAAVNFSFFLGAVDELIQYAIGWSVYYDFNDIIFNFCGSFIGVLLVRTFEQNRKKQHKNTGKMAYCFYGANVTLGVVLLIGLFTNIICFFSDEHCLVHLCTWETGRLSMEFWHTLSWGDHWHRVRPIPGALTFILLPLTGLGLRNLRA